MKVSTIFKMKKTQFCVLKLFHFGNYLCLRTLQGKTKWNCLCWSKINFYLFPVLLSLFSRYNETFFLCCCKTKWWVPPPTWLSPSKQKELSLQGKVIVHMMAITVSSSGCSQVPLWTHRSGTMEVGWVQWGQQRMEGLETSPSSTAHYPAWVSQPAWNIPSDSPEKAWVSSCIRKQGVSALKSRWLLAPKWGNPMSSREETSVSLNCLGLHPSFRCPPRAASLARCGAVSAFLVTGTAMTLQRMRKHKTGTGKRLQEEAPWRCCICSISFFSAGILISQLKRTASCRIWLDLLCFLQISLPIITCCCAPGNVYFWALFDTRLHRLEL